MENSVLYMLLICELLDYKNGQCKNQSPVRVCWTFHPQHEHASLPIHYSHLVVANGTATRVSGTYFQSLQVDESDLRSRRSSGAPSYVPPPSCAHLLGFYTGCTLASQHQSSPRTHGKLISKSVCVCVCSHSCVLSLSNRVTPQHAV